MKNKFVKESKRVIEELGGVSTDSSPNLLTLETKVGKLIIVIGGYLIFARFVHEEKAGKRFKTGPSCKYNLVLTPKLYSLEENLEFVRNHFKAVI